MFMSVTHVRDIYKVESPITLSFVLCYGNPMQIRQDKKKSNKLVALFAIPYVRSDAIQEYA